MLDAPLPMPFIITSSKSHQLKPQGNILGKIRYIVTKVFITKIKNHNFSAVLFKQVPDSVQLKIPLVLQTMIILGKFYVTLLSESR